MERFIFGHPPLIIKGSNESINVLLGITYCRDVAVAICTLEKLQAFENHSVKALQYLVPVRPH